MRETHHPSRMIYYAHTADGPDGQPLPESSGRWQPLRTHLENVANLAAGFAAPFNASAEARLAGLLHDLGKYRDEFQSYLRGERASSAETQHAIFGAAWAADETRQIPCTALAIAGHHAGLHNQCDIEGMCTKRGLHIPESVPTLIAQLEGELGPLPATPLPPSWVSDEHSAEFYLLRELERTPDDLDIIRGVEGRAAALHFEVFARHLRPPLRPQFPFAGRNRRPPRDAVNALLSFLYALLRHDSVAALTAVGLDPFVGFLHADRSGRESLALDLMEEFRPWVERLALTLLNRSELKAAHFVTREGGAVELTEAARKLLVGAYQQRKAEEITHPLFAEKVRHAQLPFIQARLLARALRDDAPYAPHLFT